MLKDVFIISSIVLACCFFFILICNFKLKSKIIKISFLVLSLIYLLLIVLFDKEYVYQALKAIITYLWYPNYLIVVTITVVTIITFIYTLLNKKMCLSNQIINYFEFCLIFVCYVMFLRLGIDTNSYTSLYSKGSLIIMRITTISFLTWAIVNLILKRINRGIK